MTRTQTVVATLGLFLVGLYGCSQSTSGSSAKNLESRVAKLEDDLKTAISSRDALKTRLAALEEQVRAESDRAKLIEKERDDLTARLQAKSLERDAVAGNYDELVKKLEALLGQAKVTQAKQDGKVTATVTSLPK